jgi:hypothetical protein
MLEEGEATVTIRAGGNEDERRERTARAELAELLEETAAYRQHFRGSDAASLVANYQ